MAVALLLGGAACAGEGDDERDASPQSECATPPTPVADPVLPDGIPWPEGVDATSVDRGADLLVVEGHGPGSVDEIARTFEDAFASRTLVTLEADEASDGDGATYTVGGPSTSGTLVLTTSCDGVDVRLELRPLVGG